MFVGNEDAVTPAAQTHHSAGSLPGGETGRRPVHVIHLNTAGEVCVSKTCVCAKRFNLETLTNMITDSTQQ